MDSAREYQPDSKNPAFVVQNYDSLQNMNEKRLIQERLDDKWEDPFAYLSLQNQKFNYYQRVEKQLNKEGKSIVTHGHLQKFQIMRIPRAFYESHQQREKAIRLKRGQQAAANAQQNARGSDIVNEDGTVSQKAVHLTAEELLQQEHLKVVRNFKKSISEEKKWQMELLNLKMKRLNVEKSQLNSSRWTNNSPVNRAKASLSQHGSQQELLTPRGNLPSVKQNLRPDEQSLINNNSNLDQILVKSNSESAFKVPNISDNVKNDKRIQRILMRCGSLPSPLVGSPQQQTPEQLISEVQKKLFFLQKTNIQPQILLSPRGPRGDESQIQGMLKWRRNVDAKRNSVQQSKDSAPPASTKKQFLRRKSFDLQNERTQEQELLLLQQLTPQQQRAQKKDKRYHQFKVFIASTPSKEQLSPLSQHSLLHKQIESKSQPQLLEPVNKHKRFIPKEEQVGSILHLLKEAEKAGEQSQKKNGTVSLPLTPATLQTKVNSQSNLSPQKQFQRQNKRPDTINRALELVDQFKLELSKSLPYLKNPKFTPIEKQNNFLLELENYYQKRYPDMTEQQLKVSKEQREKIFQLRKDLLLHYKYD